MMEIRLSTLTLFLLCGGFHMALPKRILLMPGPVFSHVNFFSSAGKALVEDGHEVYVLTTAQFESAVQKFGLDTIIHRVPPGQPDAMEILEPKIAEVAKGQISVPQMFASFLPLMTDLTRQINRNKPLMDRLEDLKFDLSMNDGVFFYSTFYVIPYRLNIKYMTLTAMHDPWTNGVTGLPSVEPAQLTSYTNRMSFFQRLTNIIPFSVLAANPVSLFFEEDIVSEFAPHRPQKSIREIIWGSEMTLVNHEVICIGYPRLSSPNYQFIGGSSIRPPNPLPKDLDEFVGGAKEGLIVLGFGSVKALHALWPQLKPKVLGALGRLRQRAVVQYALDDVEDAPPNVKLVKWMPQNDLLGHRNTKVFITHGGNNGQLEAVYHGVPILTIPFNGDQFSNANQARERGFGLVLDRFAFTENQLYDTLKELVENPSYSQSIRRCSNIMRSMPSSQDRLVFWVNHILEFGGDHLRSPAMEMPMYKLMLWDVCAFLIAVFAVFCFLIYLCCSQCVKCVFRGNKTKTE